MTDLGSQETPDRQPFQLDIGRIGLFVVVPVICWAFYTTSSGMVDIMRKGPEDLFGLIGAVIGSAAILAMLALTSWSLGADLAALLTRQMGAKGPPVGKVIIVASVFAFVFSISAFFSFTYYYNNIFGLSGRKITNEDQPREIARVVLIPLQQTIRSTYETETNRIVASPGATAYFGFLDAILKAAGGGGENFREHIRKSQEAMQLAAGEAAKQLQEAKRQLENSGKKVAQFDREIEDLDKIIQPKEAEIKELRSMAEAEDQLAVDAERGLDNKGAKCGPNCRQHRTKAAEHRRRIKTLEDTLAPNVKKRTDKVKERDKVVEQIAVLRQKVDNATPPPTLDVQDPSATLRAFSDARNRVRLDPTWENVTQAKGPCGIVLNIERQLKMVSTEVPADFACEPLATETREMLTARDKVLAGRVEFEKKCSLNGEIGPQLDAIADRIRSSDKPQEINGLFEAKKLVDACIVAGRATGLSESQIQDYLKKSADFANSNTLDRNRFNIAVEAFWRGTANSNMAIGVAVAQDAFILVLKLLADIFGREMKPRVRPASGVPVDISDREQDPPEIRAVKALLRLAHPAPNDTSEFELESANSNLPSEVRENLKAFMNRMVRQDRAHVSRRGVYVIENSTIHEFEAELRTQPKAPVVKSAGTNSQAQRPAQSRWSDRGDLAPPLEQNVANVASDSAEQLGNSNTPGRRRRASALARQYFSSGDPADATDPIDDTASPGRDTPAPKQTPGLAARERTRTADTRSNSEGRTDEVTFDSLRARRKLSGES